jgi:hypothetical protein
MKSYITLHSYSISICNIVMKERSLTLQHAPTVFKHYNNVHSHCIAIGNDVTRMNPFLLL